MEIRSSERCLAVIGKIGRAACICVGVLVSGTALADGPPLRETIDSQLRAAWQQANVQPGALTTDAEFLRRVSLDLIGVIPAHDEAAAFLDDPATDKRSRLIDRLLADPRYARHQADVWDQTLFGRYPPGYETHRRDGIEAWLRRQFEGNVPYDQWVRALLKAEGNSVDDGPPMYFNQYRNQPEDANEAITQTFLGVQLQCARCHDHPFEPWTQQDFYGMAAFLARLQIVTVGKQETLLKFAVAEKSSGDLLFSGLAKDQQPGRQGEPVKPRFLLGDPLAEPPLPEGFKEVKFEDNKPVTPPLFSRKNQLADWITRADNPFFARAITNRIWAQYFGRGLIHPVDNMSPSNKPSHPELLDALTRELVAHQFDLKWYMRELTNSQAYQVSSHDTSADSLPATYATGRVRPLTAEELLDSWRAAAWYDVSERNANPPPNRSRFHPIDRGYMLQFFGTPNNGAGDFQGGLQEHLFLNNGPLSTLIVAGKGSLMEWLNVPETPIEQRIERLYLSTLTRRPTAEESAKLIELVALENGKSNRWADVLWALMTCSEFRFNH